MSDDEEINKDAITPTAVELNLLALNTALESFRLGARGKQTAICAEDIRNLAYEICILLDENTAVQAKKIVMPWSKNPLSTVNQNNEFMLFMVAGVPIVENLIYIQEVAVGLEETNGYINLRGKEIPVLDMFKILDKSLENRTFIILRTPWADKNHEFAVIVDSCSGLFYCPIGTPIKPPVDNLISRYVRECWENENGEPFYFMDWNKLYEYRANNRTKR